MMTELMLVEGVSDVQLISYYLQNVYGWSYEKKNVLGIMPLDEHEHIEGLKKDENHLVLCGVGGNGKFAHFIKKHHVNDMMIEQNISSIMVVTDRDQDSYTKIRRTIQNSLEYVKVEVGKWICNTITDSFGQPKLIDTYLLVIPEDKEGALERVIIDALYDIPEENSLIQEVTSFIDALKKDLLPELLQINKYNKATVGTFFSVRDPKNAMRSFATFISKIDWSKSEYLKNLFLPFDYLGKAKDIE